MAAAAICTAAGVVFSAALERRCCVLREISAMLAEMQVKIRYRSVRLSELTDELAESGVYPHCSFIRAAADDIRAGMPVSEAWGAAVSKALFLTAGDRDILLGIGSGLGGSDTDGQLSLLALGAAMIGRALEEAERERAAKSRMLLGVWTLCGIGAGIMIL
ncbi:MAG: stage III sporulation protein AB [Ruminiclostridium sp.]|nr:stage III sporulation protein AB [Ruminiclostridium sp.]